jgi:polyhydroxyalkanoate synthesis regulator phasin
LAHLKYIIIILIVGVFTLFLPLQAYSLQSVSTTPSSPIKSGLSKTGIKTNSISASNTAPMTSPEYTGSVFWNGGKFSGIYDNTVGNCALGRVNTQYGALTSFISDIENDENSLSSESEILFGHGLTESYAYKYDQYSTHVMANNSSIQFWHGSQSMNNSGLATKLVSINVLDSDDFGESIDTNYLKDKNIIIISRGIEIEYGSGLSSIERYKNIYFSISDQDDISFDSDSGDVDFKINTNFSGKNSNDYDAIVHYTAVIYDADDVSIKEFDVDSDDLDCSGSTCSGYKSFTVSDIKTSMSEGQIAEGDISSFVVGLNSWGFSSSSAIEAKKIRAGAKFYSWENAANKAKIFAWGEIYKDDCKAASDGSETIKANKLKGYLIGCADDVCEAVYSKGQGEEESWIKERVASVKEKFSDFVSNAQDKIEDVKDSVKDKADDVKETVQDIKDNIKDKATSVIEKIKDKISDMISSVKQDFPSNQVLVVLKESTDTSILDNNTKNTNVKSVYSKYGTPTVNKTFPQFDSDEDVEDHIEDILSQTNFRADLFKIGITQSLTYPPLHLFYTLSFKSSLSDSDRDNIISDLQSSNKLQSVSKDYIEKLSSAPGDEYHTSTLYWMRPYVKEWWDVNSALIYIVLNLFDTDTIYKGVLALREDGSSSATTKTTSKSTSYKVSSSSVKKIKHTFDPKIKDTHFQFSGRPPFEKNVCKKKFKDFGVKRKKVMDLSICKENEVLVKFKSGINPVDVTQLTTLQMVQEKKFKRIKVYKYSFPASKDISNILEELQNSENIEYAEPNYRVFPNSEYAGNDYDPVFHEGSGEDDYHWPYVNMKIFEAWKIWTGSRNTMVAVLDTGVDICHEDFWENSYSDYYCRNNLHTPYDFARLVAAKYQGNIYMNHAEFNLWLANNDEGYGDPDTASNRDADGNGYEYDFYGWNFKDNDNESYNTCDDNHGTSVASLIAAHGNNQKAFSGVAQHITLLPMQILNNQCDAFYADEIIEATEYAGIMGAKIANLSSGGYVYTQAKKDMIDTYPNILFVASAGNDGNDNDLKPFYPSGYANLLLNEDESSSKNVISVLALDSKNQRVFTDWSSNYGKKTVEIGAAGNEVFTSMDGGSYINFSGTSSAAPFVSGAAALVASYCPSLTAVELKAILLDSVTKLDSLADITTSGGMLNVEEALKLADERCTGPKGEDSECENKYQQCIDANLSDSATESNCSSKYDGAWFGCDSDDPLCDEEKDAVCSCGSCNKSSSGSYGCSLNTDTKPNPSGFHFFALCLGLILISRFRFKNKTV